METFEDVAFAAFLLRFLPYIDALAVFQDQLEITDEDASECMYPDVYFHFGWWKGFRSAIIRDERHRRFLVILGNTTYIIPPDVTFEFMEDTSVMLPESEPLN